ncbi:PAS domain-containing protein [Ferrovibrio sp.]|uniref:PAS domain-containing protein n=1 Tax=Ferrovibrio sp. TaxID=1917215 RepID=UPI00311D89CE
MTAFALPDSAHPVMRDAHAYWHGIAPAAGLLPGRQHVDPTAIPRLLPHVWLMEVHPPAPGGQIPRFRFRLVGSHVDLGFGEAKTGRWLDEFEPEFNSDAAMNGAWVACVRHATPAYRRGRPRFRFNHNAVELERMILPLAANGHDVDMLFGTTIFYDERGEVLQEML